MKLWTRSFDSHFGRIQLASDDEALIAVALPGQTDHQFHEQLVKRSSATDFAVDGPVNLEASDNCVLISKVACSDSTCP